MPHTMDPSFAIVQKVNSELAEEKFRDRVRELHEQEVPLSQMVTDLGLNLTPKIKEILDGLAPDVVKGIRTATLEMLDGDIYVMPLDCAVTKDELRDSEVKVRVKKTDHRDRIHVEKKKKG